MARTTGIDISRHQGYINWENVHAAIRAGSLNWICLRAGYGGGGIDEQFPRNRDEARNRSIPRQFYFYAYPGRSSGRVQAEEFFQRVGALQSGESLALDIEDDPVFGRNLATGDVQWCLDFLNRCKELFGVKPLIYMNSNVLGRFTWNPVVDGDFGLWIANYGKNNGQPGTEPSSAPWKFWAQWQYSSKGNAGGISPVDVNVFSGDITMFLKYGLQTAAPTPTPTPVPIPTPSPKPATTYKVVKNDTLSAIGARHGTSWQAIYAANKAIIGADPNKIKVGMVLVIPNGSTPVAPQPSMPVNHIVVRGETLGKIASNFKTTVNQLITWNKTKYPSIGTGKDSHVEAGWSIRVK